MLSPCSPGLSLSGLLESLPSPAPSAGQESDLWGPSAARPIERHGRRVLNSPNPLKVFFADLLDIDAETSELGLVSGLALGVLVAPEPVIFSLSQAVAAVAA